MTSKKDRAAVDADVSDVEKALATANALYVKYLGAQRQQHKVSEEVSAAVAAAKAVYDKVVATENAKATSANDAVADARDSLTAFQDKTNSELGVYINLLQPPPGGFTNL